MSAAVTIRPFFSETSFHKSILGRFWHHVLDMCPISRGTVLSSRRECNSKQFCILLRECLYCQSNMHENVACLFAGYEQGQFLLWGTLRDKIYKMYSKNLCTKDDLREKEVKKDSKCSVFHFTSRTLIWRNNEYFRYAVTRLEAEGYLQLNSDESTDTWTPKLPQQCVARWCGWSSYNPGWATAMFRRNDHTHCLRLLGDLRYSIWVAVS